MDRGQVYAVPVLPPQPQQAQQNNDAAIEQQQNRVATVAQFHRFVNHFRQDHQFILRDKLKSNCFVNQHFLEVDLALLSAFDEELANNVRERPANYLPMFEEALKQVAKDNGFVADLDEVPDFQVLLLSNANPIPVRELDSTYVSKLVKIHGITIAAANPTAKGTHIQIMCRTCRHTKVMPVGSGITGIQLPRKCDG
ncbi:minichromosome maintenance protein 5, partial [Rhizoclosmatium hyalinum]